MSSAVTPASSGTGMSEVPAVTTRTEPRVAFGGFPIDTIAAFSWYATRFPTNAFRRGASPSGEARVARTSLCDSDIRRAISTMRSGGLPRQRITSGNPRRRSRCESSLANPRSWYGRSRRASIAGPRVTFPAFGSRSSASTRCRSTASPDLFPLLELQDGAQGAAPFDLFADPVLPFEDVNRAFRHLDRLLLGHDDEPGFVSDDPVARVDLLAPAVDLAPDFPETFRLAGVRGDVAAEAREIQIHDRVKVPHRAVDHDAGHALHEARVARGLPPGCPRSATDVNHDHVAWLCAADRLPPFRPVALRRPHGDRAPDAPRAVLDPRDKARHHPAFLHRVRQVRGGHLPEGLPHVGLRILLERAARDRLPTPDRLLDRPGRVRDVLGLDDRAANDQDRGPCGHRLRDRLGVQASRDRHRQGRR